MDSFESSFFGEKSRSLISWTKNVGTYETSLERLQQEMKENHDLKNCLTNQRDSEAGNHIVLPRRTIVNIISHFNVGLAEPCQLHLGQMQDRYGIKRSLTKMPRLDRTHTPTRAMFKLLTYCYDENKSCQIQRINLPGSPRNRAVCLKPVDLQTSACA